MCAICRERILLLLTVWLHSVCVRTLMHLSVCAHSYICILICIVFERAATDYVYVQYTVNTFYKQRTHSTVMERAATDYVRLHLRVCAAHLNLLALQETY